MTTTRIINTAAHERRTVEQFTLDAADFAASSIMNDTDALDAVVALAAIRQGTRVLDVACGPGIVARRLASAGASVTGVDVTPKMLAIAAEHGRAVGHDIAWIHGSMYNLPLSDYSFDVVVSRYALHHAHQLERAATEISRVADTTARLVIVDFAAHDDPDVARAYDDAERHRDPTHARNLTPTEQRQVFESLGWMMTERRSYRLPASVAAVLAGSSGPDHNSYRAAFEASLDSHGLGVGARRSGSDIRFDYPIIAHAFTRTG